jgi:hypothetical protein
MRFLESAGQQIIPPPTRREGIMSKDKIAELCSAAVEHPGRAEH